MVFTASLLHHQKFISHSRFRHNQEMDYCHFIFYFDEFLPWAYCSASSTKTALIQFLYRKLFTFYILHFVWLKITDEGLVPEMRIWSILLIKSDIKWCIHLSRSFFLYFNYFGECHCWWTWESPRAHVAKFYGRLRLSRSVWEHQNFLR